MLDSVYIKNFKAYARETIPLQKNNLIIGENDSGKSTILEAIDIFFNEEKIPNVKLVRNMDEDVEIGIRLGNKFYKKKYVGKTKKQEIVVGDFSEIDTLKYLYLKPNSIDPIKLINDLASAKAINLISDDTKNVLLSIMTSAIDEVLQDIDTELLVVNSEDTTFGYENTLKLDAAIKYAITSQGIPIEGRGSGYQKNLVYGLLTHSEYDNVILAIDEIENSFSINNVLNLISQINNKFSQTIISTHSTHVVQGSSSMNLIPRFTRSYDTLVELIQALDKTNNEVFVLVEGKFDIPWINKVLELINDQTRNYRVIPGGGADNIEHLFHSLIPTGRRLVKIKDGDSADETCKLSRDTIELYTPLNDLNRILGLTLAEMPITWDELKNSAVTSTRNEDSVKNIVSNNVNSFLTESNPIVDEIREIINRQIND